ncbi:MAG: oligosaccharide flippase family protein, partial [bacterium]
MLKRLFRDSVLYTLSTVMTRGISFILLPVYTQTLTPEEFGLLDYFVALGAIASILVTLEVIQAMARFVPERSIDPILKREYASTCLWFTVATHSAMLVLVTSMSTDLASWLFSSPQRAGLIDLAAWSYWVTGIVNVVHGQLRFELRAATSALLSLLSALLTVACTLIFVVWLQWGVRGALLAQVIGGILSLLPGGYLTRASFSLRFSSSVLRQALAYSVPLIPSSLAVVLTSYFDRIALKELMGLSEVGIYAVGQKISLVVALALIGFRSALTPLIYANHEHASTPDDLAKVFRIFCVAALSLTAFLSVFAAEIVSLISSDLYQEAARVVPLQAFAVLMANVYIFAPGLDI